MANPVISKLWLFPDVFSTTFLYNQGGESLGAFGDSPHPLTKRGLQVSLINAPFWGLNASKTIGKNISFCKTKNRKYVKAYTIPEDPKTTSQLLHRSYFSQISQLYKSTLLTSHDYKAFSLIAKFTNPPANGRNMFFKTYFEKPPPAVAKIIYDVIVNSPGPLPDVECTFLPFAFLSITFIKGLHAGFSLHFPCNALGDCQFNLPFRDDTGYFQIRSISPPNFAVSGWYPYRWEWWI